MNTPTLVRETHWVCPNCDLTDVTNDPRPHSRMHNCRGLLGMSTPMVEHGVNCKVELKEREDYIGDETVLLGPEGRPWMSAVTTRDDGQDCAVYAPLATGKLRDHGVTDEWADRLARRWTGK